LALNKIKNLLNDFLKINFDIFDSKNSSNFKKIIDDFKKKVELIDILSNNFIKKSFKKLKSAEASFNLLQDVKSITKVDLPMTSEVLDRYSNEIEQIEIIFEKEKKNPPISKNLPISY
jgi:dynein heavy chain, axonemal